MKARLLVVLSTVVPLALATPAGASFPGGNGTGVVKLTVGTRSKLDPAWSADGTKIAFASVSARREPRGQLETMNADGSGRAIVVAYDGDRTVVDPTWSPDGTKIAFCLFAPNGARIWLVNADGSNLMRLSGRGQDDCHPDWSSDGTEIAFVDPGGLLVMDADGSNRRMLVRGDANFPSWSPDGLRIAFTRQPGRGRADVFVVNADGTGRTRLTSTDRRWEFTPTWSPDGASIGFCRTMGRTLLSPCEIWTMEPDGSNPAQITTTPNVDEFQLSWQAT